MNESLPSLSLPSLVSVIRGQVLTADGTPLIGVNVTFVHYPEHGFTVTRKDGMCVFMFCLYWYTIYVTWVFFPASWDCLPSLISQNFLSSKILWDQYEVPDDIEIKYSRLCTLLLFSNKIYCTSWGSDSTRYWNKPTARCVFGTLFTYWISTVYIRNSQRLISSIAAVPQVLLPILHLYECNNQKGHWTQTCTAHSLGHFVKAKRTDVIHTLHILLISAPHPFHCPL